MARIPPSDGHATADELTPGLLRDVQEHLALRRALSPHAPGHDHDHLWDRFYRAYRSTVNRLAREACLPGPDRDDARQVVWDAVLSGPLLSGYDPHRGPFRPWLLAAGRRLLRRWKHRAARAVEPLEPTMGNRVPGRERDPADAWQQRRRAELVHSALERLKPRISDLEYEVFRRHRIDAQRLADIAKERGITDNYACVCHHRAKQVFREVFLQIINERTGGAADQSDGLHDFFF